MNNKKNIIIIVLVFLIGCSTTKRERAVDHEYYFRQKAAKLTTWSDKQLSDFEKEYHFVTNEESVMYNLYFKDDLKRNIHFLNHNAETMTYTIIQPSISFFNHINLVNLTQFKYVSENKTPEYQWNPIFEDKGKVVLAIKLISDLTGVDKKELLNNNVFTFTLLKNSLYVSVMSFTFYENPLPGSNPFIKIDLETNKIVYNVIVG